MLMSILDVVKCEVSDTELVSKFPSDKIRLGSQLVVYPGQTAMKAKRYYIHLVIGTNRLLSRNSKESPYKMR